MFPDLLRVHFAVSGVDTWVFLPPLVAFVVSTITSMGGVSGAFLLLPFQVSVLNFTSPSVSATNFVFNIVAIPSGVYRYLKEGRMAWPLTWVVIVGTLPGVFIGYYLRVRYLPNPVSFKMFVGCVLLYIGTRLLYEMTERSQEGKREMKALDDMFNQHARQLRASQAARVSSGLPPEAVVKTIHWSLSRVEYEFWGQRFSFSTIGMFMLAFVVGIIGGTYGIGGGAIIAPFCVAVFQLPVYTVAGAALLGTFITSVAGVFFYSIIPAETGLSCAPDWLLGSLFGFGGFAGMYCGARLQKFVPQKILKLILGLLITFLAVNYILQYFMR
ncbi:MAG TPA: hypothetical protein DCZ69_19140 [Syntrophobacteraceae bacterium]|nr:hypothetical protein [Syntrophobacteraceae bacterium]HBZ55047.1 hypothetical protein [Syntrophobacteraceae bacterium]